MRPWLSEPRSPVRGDKRRLARRHRAPSSRPATRCCSSAPSSSPTPTSDSWDFRARHRGRADSAARPHARELGARPRVDAAVLRSGRASPRCIALRRRAAVFGHNAPIWRSLNDELPGRLHGRSSAAAHRRPRVAGTSTVEPGRDAPAAAAWISIPSSRTSLPTSRMTGRGAASRCSPRATSTGPTSISRLEPMSSSTAVTGRRRGVARGVCAVGQGDAACARRREPRHDFPQARARNLGFRTERVPAAGRVPGRPTPVSGASIPVAVARGRAAAGASAARSRQARKRRRGGRAPGHARRRASDRCEPAARSRSTPPLPEALRPRQRRRARQRRAGLARRDGDRRFSAPATPRTPFQRFELKQLPLTYRAAANETGADERAHAARRRHRVDGAADAVRRSADRARLHARGRRARPQLRRASATACAARACRAA